jgi:site-specific recombinase XerD
MKVAFYVRPSRDKGYLINLRVTLGVGEQYRFSTGQKVNDIKNWTGENVKRSRSEPNALQTNHYLSKLKNYLNASLYDLVKEQEEINKESIFKLLEGFKLSPQERQKNSSFDFCDLIGEFIGLGISGKIKKKDGNKYTKTTLIKGYGNLQKHICSYEKENGSIKVNKVDYKLYQDLLHYFDEVELEKASQSRLIKDFKSFITKAQLYFNIKFDNYKKELWVKPSGESLNTYYTKAELYKLLEADLSEIQNHKTKERVRDFFVMNALSFGMRISDLRNFDKYDRKQKDGYEVIIYKQQKTSAEVYAPITSLAKDILKKYDNKLELPSDQKCNEYLKEICEVAGFTKTLELKDKKGDVIKSAKKFELTSNHTARRSFCTNAYKEGLDTLLIMSISGHSTIDSFLDYIKVTKEEFAERFAQTDYFKLMTSSAKPDLRIA